MTDKKPPKYVRGHPLKLYMRHYFATRHSESDMVIWAARTHSDTCYRLDKIELLQDILVEWVERGIAVCGKYYPGTWTTDWSGYYQNAR